MCASCHVGIEAGFAAVVGLRAAWVVRLRRAAEAGADDDVAEAGPVDEPVAPRA